MYVCIREEYEREESPKGDLCNSQYLISILNKFGKMSDDGTSLMIRLKAGELKGMVMMGLARWKELYFILL